MSGTPSDPRATYHCRIELSEPLPHPFAESVWWIKADMVATVGLKRLDLFRTGRDQEGKRKYLTKLKVSEPEFERIRTAVANALGLLN